MPEKKNMKKLFSIFNINSELEKVATSFRAKYIDMRNEGIGVFDARLWRLRIRALKGVVALDSIRKIIENTYKTSTTSGEAISRMYDIEYGGIDEPHYAYLNALLYKSSFEHVTGYSLEEVKKLKIIDVGAGSNELLRYCHTEFGVPSDQLYGSDISLASKDIIEKDGFHGYVGRIENLALPDNNFDAVFLTYFIDYDTDQRTTFENALKIIRFGGRIILEGLFPCKPFGLLDTDKEKHTFITKGNNAPEDLSLVCSAFINIGREQNKKIIVEKIVRGWRYTYSHYGLNKLPSYFIVLKVTK